MREKLLWVQINWVFGEPYIDFEKCAVFVANLFTYQLPKVICKGVSKVNIDFTDYPDMEGISKFDSILTITELFPICIFDQKNMAEKIELLISETYRCLKLIYQYLNLDVAQLDDGYVKIVSNPHQLVTTLIGGAKLNKNRSISADVTAEYFLDSTEIKLNFQNKSNGVISCIPLFKIGPGVLFYNGLLKTSKWIDNNIFELTNKTREITFRVTIDGLVTIHYQPIDRDIEGIKEEIIFFTLERSFEL